MKKNRAMRLAVLMLVLVMMTSCFVGGTFAKYTTSVEFEDEARVAYWGFTQNSETTFNLFESNDAAVKDMGSGLLAPGSEGSATIQFVYTEYGTTATAPEVDYTFDITVTATGAEGEAADTDALDANPNFKWTLDDAEYSTFAELKTAIENLAGNEAKYEAGTLPSAFYGATGQGDGEYTIGWKWLFETAGDGMAAQDETDTAMGNATDLDDLCITITITATQIN